MGCGIALSEADVGRGLVTGFGDRVGEAADRHRGEQNDREGSLEQSSRYPE
jgi:hypothetical protein